MILENCTYENDARVGKEARGLRDNGFQVSVISPEPLKWPRVEIIDGITVYGFPKARLGGSVFSYIFEYSYSILAIATMTAFVFFRNGFDIIHVANPPDAILPISALYKFAGKRLIFDQHDLAPELYSVKFVSPVRMLAKILLYLRHLSYVLSDHVIVPNESYRQMALDRGRLRPDNVTVVRNGPVMENATTTDVRAKLPKDKTIIAFAGAISCQDGLDGLCKILASLRFDYKREDFVCVVVGDGDALPDVKSLAHELRVEDKFHFVGWVAEPALYFGYLAASDICVAPEPYNGYNNLSTSVKILDYMFAAKPIVCFDLCENRLTAREAGVYVLGNDYREFAASLVRLMDDREARRRLGAYGRRRIENELAWKFSIPALLKAYNHVLSDRLQ